MAKLTLKKLLLISVVLVFAAFCSGIYALFFSVFFISTTGMLVYAFVRQRCSKNSLSDIRWTAGWLFTVCFSIIFVTARNFPGIHTGLGIILFLLCSITVCATVTLLLYVKAFRVNISKKIILTYLPVFAIMSAVIIFSFDSFQGYASLDSREYYTAMQMININTLNDINVLKLCNHMSISFALIVYVLSCVIGNLYTAAILFNVLSLAASTFVVYKIIKIICPNCNNGFAYLCTAVFAFSPYTFGMTGYIAANIALMYAALFFFWAYLSKNDIAVFITALILMFTFETGFLIAGVLIFGPILISLFRGNPKKVLREQLLSFSTILTIIICVGFLIILLLKTWVGSGWLEIGFNGTLYASLILLSNFNWIMFLIIAAAGIRLAVCIASKKTDFKTFFLQHKMLVPFITVFFLLLLFNTVVITWNFPRYILVHTICLYFIAFWSLNYLFQGFTKIKKSFVYFLPLCVLVLFCVQSYFTIDPVMLSNKDKIYMGNGVSYLVNAGYYCTGKTPNVSDVYIYNKQKMQLDIAFDKVLAVINYNKDACIIVDNLLQANGGYHGKGFVLTPPQQGQGWDAEKGRRFDTYDDNEKIKYIMIEKTIETNIETGVETVIEVGEQIKEYISSGVYTEYWFLDYNSGSFPYEGDFGIKAAEQHTVSHFGWKFTVSKITL